MAEKTLEEMRQAVAEIREKMAAAAREAGRDPAELPITIWGVKEDYDALCADRDLGIDRVILSLPAEKADSILPQLDRWAGLIRRLG